MTNTVSGAIGHGVSLDMGSTRNMLIAKQLSMLISSGMGGAEKLQLPESNRFASPDTVSLMAGAPAALSPTPAGNALFLGAASPAPLLAALGNATLEGGMGKSFTLGLTGPNGSLGKDVVEFVGGKVAGAETLVDFAKVVAPVASTAMLTPANATAGTTITLSDMTKITFQVAATHNPTIH